MYVQKNNIYEELFIIIGVDQDLIVIMLSVDK